VLKQLSARSTRPVERKRGADVGDVDDEEDGHGEWVLVGNDEHENIRVSIIRMRDSIRGPQRGLRLGWMMVRVTMMSSWSYTSSCVREVVHASVVEVGGGDGHDPSKSESPPSKGSTTTS
jgi:hypothetical protein